MGTPMSQTFGAGGGIRTPDHKVLETPALTAELHPQPVNR